MRWEWLRALGRSVPDARIAVAHGQMAEEQAGRIMLRFLDRDFDVLVSTTIIESGLDIPNVNTLIVTDSDYLAYPKLYQLRGRVGRSKPCGVCLLHVSQGLHSY